VRSSRPLPSAISWSATTGPARALVGLGGVPFRYVTRWVTRTYARGSILILVRISGPRSAPELPARTSLLGTSPGGCDPTSVIGRVSPPASCVVISSHELASLGANPDRVAGDQRA
jgi:hypothetical protein